MIYITEQLHNSTEWQRFYYNIKKNNTGEAIKELVYVHKRELPDCSADWSIVEKACNLCEAYDRETSLVLTDITFVYEKAVGRNIAVLPIALTEQCYDAFPGSDYLLAGLNGIDMFYLNRIYERAHHIPWHILDTERTRVREMTVEDVDALYEIYSDPAITKYTDKLYDDPEEERAYTREYIRTVYRFTEFGVWMIEDKNIPGKVIGRAGLSLREGFDTPELGYVISADYQNKGYATEVCQAIIRYAREQFDFERLRIIMTDGNEASYRLCKRLGFIFDMVVCIDGKNMQQYILELR